MNLFNTLLIISVAAVSSVLGIQVCGKFLANMLDFVCDGRGFHWINPDDLPAITKRSASRYLSQTSGLRQSRGVVAECCWKACSLGDMERYCAAPSGTYFDNPTSGPITEEVANQLSESESHIDFPTSLTTAPPQPIRTTPRPQPTPSSTQQRLPNSRSLFSGSIFGLPRNQGPNRLRNSPYFVVRFQNPTRTPGFV
ncbi:insulin-like growth factor I [Mercenaria mercenaria]|uniref:insulin-like growth factor I n=1 Tax=Mercenaria mercenaria TaxID=6596 RepID=UPI00234F11EF|nr:insulin-like growth factor I [Mercenaria mercenaria]